MKKLLLLLIKFIPIIQMMGMIINNTLYYLDSYRPICYCLDFIIGNSIITTFLICTCSYIFKFCIWHRIIILSNLITLIIANIDAIIGLPISDITLLIIYIIIYCLFIMLATLLHIKNKL